MTEDDSRTDGAEPRHQPGEQNIAGTGGQPGEQNIAGEPSSPPATGDPAVDQALAALDGLESRPLDEHQERLAEAHQALHQVLNADDEESGG